MRADMTIGNRARSSLLVLLCMVAYLWMGEAMAGTSACYAIKDQDSRNYCLAQAKGDYGYCYRIKNSDERNQCLAETRESRDRCYAIQDRDNRRACLAKIR